ncbi:MAG: hypothetical protein AB7F89_10810 [Pirellulaceae bacterium]
MPGSLRRFICITACWSLGLAAVGAIGAQEPAGDAPGVTGGAMVAGQPVDAGPWAGPSALPPSVAGDPAWSGNPPVLEPESGWGFTPNEPVWLPPFEPWIHVSGRLLWLHRTEANRTTPLVTATAPAGTFTAISTDHLNFPVEAGVRGSVVFGPRNDQFLELTYSGVFDQEARAAVAIDQLATAVTSTTQFFFGAAATSMTNFAYTATYESDFHSPELNYWFSDNDWRFRPMLGVRWIRQTDDFRVFETATPGTGGIAQTSNDLWGGQLGFQTTLYQRSDWFYVQAIGKGGVHHNGIDVRATVYTGGVAQAELTRQTDCTSWSGEIQVTAVWRLTPHFNFHAGYTGLWLTGLALAGDQQNNLDVLTDAGTVDLGWLAYQGGHLGVTLSW